MSGDHNMNQKPVAWFHEEKYKTHFTTDPSEDMIGKYWQPLYTAPQSINDFKPDWDTVKAYDEKFAEMLDEIQRLRAELKRTEQRLHDVATLCADVEAQAAITQGVLKAVNTAAMKLTADLTCMEIDNDDRLDRDRVMERVMRWRNEWDKAMFEYKPKAAPRQEPYDQTALELCGECGWKAVIPGDGCLVCARQKAKPVAWMYDFLADDRGEIIRDWVTQSYDDIKRENGFNVRPLYTAPPAVTQKPVAYVDERIHGWPDCFVMEPDPPHTVPLYTKPREWVGLTTQEIEDEWERVTGHSILGGDRSDGRSMFLSPDEVIHYTQAIEAKLKERTHAG